jgi:hypothetical protein
VTKRISLVVTYDTEAERAVVDHHASKILFPEGACWDDERECWVEDTELAEDLARRLSSHLHASVDSSNLGLRGVPVETKFIELALNIFDPDSALDPEETLEFGDAARVYLVEYPITNWEIEGAFALVAQFVHDWALSEAPGYGVRGDVSRLVSNVPTPTVLPVPSSLAVVEEEDIDYVERMPFETEDPLSGATLRMMFGEFEGTPTLALFVDDEDPPILIDRSALELAMGQWSLVVGPDEPVLAFSANADRELEVAYLEIDSGPDFV